MRLEHHLVGGYVRYISPHIILLLLYYYNIIIRCHVINLLQNYQIIIQKLTLY